MIKCNIYISKNKRNIFTNKTLKTKKTKRNLKIKTKVANRVKTNNNNNKTTV